MGWNYPEISLEEMLKVVKGFVDILILASGFQSTGGLAHWDSHNIKQALHWGSFFETVLRRIMDSDTYQDSVKELDVSLSEITSHPSFPKGLANLSCNTLVRARSLVLDHLFHPLPLRDSHLRAFLTAIIEMDLKKLSELEYDCLSAYLNKLTLQNVPLNSVPEELEFVKDPTIASEETASTVMAGSCLDDELTKFVLQEVIKRQSSVSCASTVETGLDILSNAFRNSSSTESLSSSSKEQLKHGSPSAFLGSLDQLVDFVTWNSWKSDSISYFLNKRTIRLVSGAGIIFSAPKVQWIQVFDRLISLSECKEDDLSETIELLLLGSIVSKWNYLIEYFMSVQYDSFTISKLHHEVCTLFSGRSQSFHSKDEATISKECSILEYLTGLVDGRLHLLWKVTPLLAAVAIPQWSTLFRLYVSEVDAQFKGDPFTTRWCSCVQDGKEHWNCEYSQLFPQIFQLELQKKKEKIAMKTLGGQAQTEKRIQFLRWGKRIAQTSVGGSCFLKKLLLRLKKQWKQTLWWQRKKSQHCSYDLYNYSLNFDDGSSSRYDRASSHSRVCR